MFKKLSILPRLFLLVLIASSCNQEEQPVISDQSQSVETSAVLPTSEIDQVILKSLQETGDFIWANQSDELVYSALMSSDSVLTIGYQPASISQPNSRIGLEDIAAPVWQDAANKIIKTVQETVMRNPNPAARTDTDRASVHADLPYLEMKVADINVLRKLRGMGEVRYLEPRGYEFDYSLLNGPETARVLSASGCANEPGSIPASDFVTISPNAKSSWNYLQMGISQAWSQSTGAGITVGVIDTGLSSDQVMFGSQFNSGESSNRSVQAFGTYQTGYWWWKRADGPNDQCGHGTAMSGVVASPRNTVGNSVGVAYNASLISVRGTSDVIVNSGNEKDGVADALVLLGRRSDVKIISMSIGDLFYNSKVADAIRYANNRGKLIFAAAGTSTTFTNWVGVIFPATMDETVAVTGVKEGNGYQRCDTCHSGSKVEFTVVMERAGSQTKPLTTALYSNDPSTVGGSSVATATASGIAALIWSANPSWSKDQVLNKMRETSALFPNRNSEYGFGNLNAAAAIGVY